MDERTSRTPRTPSSRQRCNGQREDRTQAVTQLFATLCPDLRAICQHEYPQLFPGSDDSENILARLPLKDYGGQVDQEAFIVWAEPLVRHDAARYRIADEIVRKYELVIWQAIHDGFGKSPAIDLSVSPEDVFQEVRMRIFETGHDLMEVGVPSKPGLPEPKLSTRIYGLTAKHFFLYHASAWNRWHRYNRLFLQGEYKSHLAYPCDYVSDAELAEKRALELTQEAS